MIPSRNSQQSFSDANFGIVEVEVFDESYNLQIDEKKIIIFFNVAAKYKNADRKSAVVEATRAKWLTFSSRHFSVKIPFL